MTSPRDQRLEAPTCLPDSSRRPAISKLIDLAYDLTWSWTPATQALFEQVDPNLWLLSGHNPVRVLAAVAPSRLDELARDAVFTASVDRQHAGLSSGPNAGQWFVDKAVGPRLDRSWRPFLAAYFCAEFGLTECFQIYSGGLGLLAGDHLRSAAQLGLPLVAVGLLYRNGYFHQVLDGNGMQQELFPPLDAPLQPVRRVLDPATGSPLRVTVDLPARRVQIGVWLCKVGSIRLYLLDTNLDQNAPLDREITANLYLGDQTRRIEQEIVLGIGGIRALKALAEQPSVYHMNEGHAAFMGLERIRMFRAANPELTFDQAREAAAPSHVFTTHTPVPAGIDRFNAGLVGRYFADYHDSLGLDLEGFMALGRENVSDKAEAFSMAVLALRISKFCNGVSRLHGVVSRKMWKNIWPNTPESDVPVGHVTNGVHTDMWVGPRMSAVYDKHLPADWRERPHDTSAWASIEKAPDRDLWAARTAARADLLRFCTLQMAAGRTGGIAARLDPEALTIGFARRFAGYKRATLLFRDAERLSRMLGGGGGGNAPNARPVQLIVSGKSHPGDTWGKHLIHDVVEFARSKFGHARVLFLEDYSIEVARHMVRGCDVWLNNPIRGLEASGTSGMKAAMNGVLNASILDGWWDEAYQPELGYEIPAHGTYPSDAPDEEREDHEATELYLLLEQRIIPDFYTRSPDGLPAKWLVRMKKCIAHLSPEFSSHRMVAEYAQRFYFPAHQAASRLLAPSTPTTRVTGMDDPREAARLADQIARYRECWPAVSIHDVRIVPTTAHCEFSVSAMVRTPGLAPDQVSIQVVCGEVDAHGNIEQAHASPLTSEPAPSGDSFAFEGRIRVPGNCSPRYGVFIRVLPQSERLVSPFIPGLICNSPIVLLRPNDPAAGPGAWGGSTGGTGANGAHNGARRTTPPAKP